jgi:hypothetical protein
MTGSWHGAEEYEDIKRMVDFWTTQQIPYWQMTPQNSLIVDGENVYVLADEGEEVVIYAATGGEFSIALPDGSYDVNLFDPKTGTTKALDATDGGDSVTLTLPDSSDWILHLTQVEP